ncbi:MAG TPA: hypothetical protein PLN05_13740 [Pyrinomonadaceae bacterium]|nr:hypothetical protein [Chloracidobacterium sp.]HBE83221.1 hypothetical protein [Blastocatellia bacterium]HRJ89930.1 hypothetical protein [Pyrinomonadaceae bacterium]HRK51486.1 hypothetical protein [Pyrinomonadaceae bacterium]
MAIVVDAISGADIANVVNNNIDGAVDLSGKRCGEFFEALAARVGDKKISVLRIWGHGTTHYASGRDYGKGNMRFVEDEVSDDTLATFEPHIRKLTPLLDTGSRVEIRGCQIALGTGEKLMLRLADIWKAEVQGSPRSQPLLSWTPPVKSAFPGATSLRGAVIIEYNDERYKKR